VNAETLFVEILDDKITFCLRSRRTDCDHILIQQKRIHVMILVTLGFWTKRAPYKTHSEKLIGQTNDVAAA
jgi:hypothetical protein